MSDSNQIVRPRIPDLILKIILYSYFYLILLFDLTIETSQIYNF